MENKRNQEKQYKVIANHAIKGKLVRSKTFPSMIKYCEDITKNSMVILEGIIEGVSNDFETIEEISSIEQEAIKTSEVLDKKRNSKVYTIDDLKVGTILGIFYEKSQIT